MAKVYLSPSDQESNVYAYGNTTEAVQCGRIAEACRAALERSGVEVKVGHMISMAQKCSESNAFGADLHVPVHTNAFNGKVMGTRMFCYSAGGKGMAACKAIFARLAPITPGESENIQVNADYYEVRVPAAPTAYIECEFHDTVEGAKWIVENTVLIGETIARGICDYFGVTFNVRKDDCQDIQNYENHSGVDGDFASHKSTAICWRYQKAKAITKKRAAPLLVLPFFYIF